MTTWRVFIREAPGRQLRRVRTLKALDVGHARGQAIDVANQYAQQARIARYRITWELYEMTWPTAEWVRVDSGSLDTALERRRATE